MRILFLCQRVPYPPDRGDRITTWRILNLLRRLGTVRVGCFVERKRDLEGVEHLRSLGLEVKAARLHPTRRRLLTLPWLLTAKPLTLPYFHSRSLARRVRGWLAEGTDLIFCYSSSMGQYVLGPDAAGAYRVMQFAELDSDKWRQLAGESGPLGRWVYGREARLLHAFERRLAAAFDLSLVVSAAEKRLFMERIPGVEPLVVENGVDTDGFCPDPDATREEAVIFTGVMNYPPNLKGVLRFLQGCWPRVRAARPGASLFIVGSDPPPALRALDGRDGVTVTGRVPRTQPWFDRARVAVAPLWIARGIQNKVLEAMSMGLPVVVTPAAHTGIDAEPGRHLLVEEAEEAFAEAVIELLAQPQRAADLGQAARERMEERYGWEAVLAELHARLARLGTGISR